MKKIIALFLALVFAIGLFSACGEKTEKSDKISIVVTAFPEYDYVMNILGQASDRAEVTMLLDNGVDLHSYQPTAADMVKISSCDVFVYVGGESDKWVSDALKEATNENMQVVSLMDVLGSQNLSKEDEFDYGGENKAEEDGEEEYDEHVWLSVKNTKKLVKSIDAAIQNADGKYAETYYDNTEEYLEKLDELDKKYEETLSAFENKTLLFADRFPFKYLCDDYSISYFAAFSGCSAESEASFETVTFLASKIDELSLPAVVVLEKSDNKIAETVISASQKKTAKIVKLDSMQSTTSKDVAAGKTYISIMEENLENIKAALTRE